MASRTHLQSHPPAEFPEPSNGLSLGHPGEVQWLISPNGAMLLAATPAGAMRLGLSPEAVERPYPLDKSMPALTDLAALAASRALDGGAVEDRDLVFWTSRGPLTLHCACRLTVVTVGDRDTDAILVRLLPIEVTAAAVTSADTGVTLSRIAERIRSGLRSRAGSALPPALAPVAPVSTAPVVAAEVPPDHLAKLAHELRTPVAAIAAMAEIMRDERFGPLVDARYRDYARSIHDSARHMLQVIESMLDRSASEEAAAPLTFVDLDVNALAAAAVESLGPLAAQARLTIETSLADRLPMVVADRRCVRQILLNLLTNALKFTPAGGRARVLTRHAADGRLWLEVADTGRGMSDEDIARFTGKAGMPPRKDALPKRDGGGHGLGMPLVHALAAANGAGIEIGSRPGEGTRVSLIFPAERIIPV